MTPLELALSYSQELHLTILPVNGATKAAHTKNWTNKPDKGEPGSSKDEAKIREWWTQWPNALVGIRTGDINGIVVVDVDRHGSSDGFKTLKGLDGIKPAETAVVLTPGAGWHLYFRYAGKLKSGTPFGPGIDFQAEGRMIIAPLNVRDGKPYAFVNGHDLTDIAPLPTSLLSRLKRTPAQQWLDRAADELEGTAVGERRAVLIKHAFGIAFEVAKGSSMKPSTAAVSPTWRGGPIHRWTRLKSRTPSGARCAMPRAKGGKSGKAAAPPLTLPDFEPADEPTDIAETLTGISHALTEYVSMGGTEANAVALWIVHVHCLDATDYTPRLRLTSPEKRCGKSTLLRTISKLVPRPLSLSGVQRRCCSEASKWFIPSCCSMRPTMLAFPTMKICGSS